MMTFSKALEVLKDGGMVTRAGWHKGGTTPYAVLKKSGSVSVNISGAHQGTLKIGTLNIYRICGKCTATI